MTVVLAMGVLLAAFADVEDRSVETKTFPGAHLVIVDNVNGSIEVTGEPGNDVHMEVTKRIRAESAERMEAAKREVKLDEQQSGDTLKLYVDGPFRCNCDDRSQRHGHQGYNVNYDFKLRVPSGARIDLYTVNGGGISVRGVGGDFDVRNVNGDIEMNDVTGSGKAHTVNGPVKVVYAANPKGPLSFETVNGSVDVAFRKGFGAEARMETLNGGMYTDYEVYAAAIEPAGATRQNGKFVLRRGGATAVRVGAGGPELRMKTVNGDIFIRDREKQ
jgi:DUF4097 and DUF4098 domain-containing protein YvlB